MRDETKTLVERLRERASLWSIRLQADPHARKPIPFGHLAIGSATQMMSEAAAHIERLGSGGVVEGLRHQVAALASEVERLERERDELRRVNEGTMTGVGMTVGIAKSWRDHLREMANELDLAINDPCEILLHDTQGGKS